MKNDRVREFEWLDTRSWEENRNFDHIKRDKVESMNSNRIIEKKIRLGRSVKNLELKPYKNGKQDEIKFIYNLKKEVLLFTAFNFKLPWAWNAPQARYNK